MIDLILYVLLGIVAIAMAVWGGFVSIKSLPAEESKLKHYWVFAVLGIGSVLLTVCVGVRNYLAQEQSAKDRHDLGELLKSQGELLAQDKSALDQVGRDLGQSRLNEEHMKGQLEMLAPLLHEDNIAGFQAIGAAIQKSLQGASPIPDQFKSMPAKQLRSETLSFVQRLRDAVSQYFRSVEELNRSHTNTSVESWGNYTRQLEYLALQLDRRYNGEFKMQAKLFRAELQRREIALPPPPPANRLYDTKTSLDMAYESTNGTFDMRAVADDLDMLARRIPEEDVKQHPRK